MTGPEVVTHLGTAALIANHGVLILPPEIIQFGQPDVQGRGMKRVDSVLLHEHLVRFLQRLHRLVRLAALPGQNALIELHPPHPATLVTHRLQHRVDLFQRT